MTVKAIQLLESATRRRSAGYFLHVEGGRIDHGHHAGNGYRALVDAQELDEAIGAAAQIVDLRETLIIVSADHSHVFNISGYPLRPLQELPYPIKSHSPGYENTLANGHGILDLVWDLDQSTGHVSETGDRPVCRIRCWVITTDPDTVAVPESTRAWIPSSVWLVSLRLVRLTPLTSRKRQYHSDPKLTPVKTWRFMPSVLAPISCAVRSRTRTFFMS
jgi:hypothetical protein